MCIGSNSVNQAQDLISVTKFEDFPNSLLPNIQPDISTSFHNWMSNEINCEEIENVQNELWNELQKLKVERKIKPATNLYHCVSSCLIHLVVVSHLKCILYSETGSGLETGDSPPAASPLWTPAHVSWWSPSEDSGWRCQHWPRWSCHPSASQSGNLLRIMDIRKIAICCR